MRVLIGCEFSGSTRDAFRRAGHDAFSCDLQKPEGEFRRHHFRCDVRDVISLGWDLAIFHPECRYLANSGAKHLYLAKRVLVTPKPGKKGQPRWEMQRRKAHGPDPERWAKMREAAEFFKLCLNADIPRVVVENPIMHEHAAVLIGVDWTQTIQPYEYGHKETKRTCLWLRNVPELVPTNIVCTAKEAVARVHMMSPGKQRSKERGRTYAGWSDAMATQWGKLD